MRGSRKHMGMFLNPNMNAHAWFPELCHFCLIFAMNLKLLKNRRKRRRLRSCLSSSCLWPMASSLGRMGSCTLVSPAWATSTGAPCSCESFLYPRLHLRLPAEGSSWDPGVTAPLHCLCCLLRSHALRKKENPFFLGFVLDILTCEHRQNILTCKQNDKGLNLQLPALKIYDKK